MQLQIIGHIQSPFKDKFGTPRQSQIAAKTLSQIVWDLQVVPPEMWSGLREGDYLWVIFGFHLNQQKKKISKVHPPRLRGESLGVFATRTPHRPNALGLSLGKIQQLDKNFMTLSGLDLVDQTPVYDVKPFLPVYDQPQETPEFWTQQVPFPHLEVEFADQALSQIPQGEELREQLTEILQEDPRPLAYLNRPEHQYWLKYGDYDVGFEIQEGLLRVNEVRLLPKP